MTAYLRRMSSHNRALLAICFALLLVTGGLFWLRQALGATRNPDAHLRLASLRPVPGALGPTATSGTLTAATQTVSLLVGDQGTVSCQVTGTWSATLIFEGTIDNVNWATIHANALSSDTLVTAPASDGIYILGSGMTAVRVRCTAYTSGTATVTLRATPNTSAVLPVSAAGWGSGGGGGGGGAVTIADGADVTKGAIADSAVQGDNNGTVSAKLRGINKTLTAGVGVTSLPALTAGSNTIGTVNVGTPFSASAALSDATTNPSTTLVGAMPSTWNGSTWDRVKDAGAANNQGGYSGIQAVNLSVLDTVNSQMRRTLAASSLIAGGADGTHVPSFGPAVYAGGNQFFDLKGNTDGSLPVGGFTTLIQTSPTITAAAYSAGQDIGGAITFASATRLSAGTGVIQSVGISDKAKQSAAIDLIFFNAAPTAPTDHATFNPSNADIAKIVGIVSVTATNYSAFSANSTAFVGNVGLPFNLTSGTTLNCVAVCRGTPTYASTSDIQVSCGIAED